MAGQTDGCQTDGIRQEGIFANFVCTTPALGRAAKKNWLPWVTMSDHGLPQVTMSGREIEQPGAAAAPSSRQR